jgi:hypothetical protein
VGYLFQIARDMMDRPDSQVAVGCRCNTNHPWIRNYTFKALLPNWSRDYIRGIICTIGPSLKATKASYSWY